MGYLKRKFQFIEKPDQYPDFETLDKRYGNWYVFLSFLVLPVMIAGVIAVVFVLQAIMRWWMPEFKEAIFVLEIEPWSLILPAIFLGIFAVIPIMMLITKILLGKRDHEYYYYSNWKNESDGLKILIFLSKIIMPPTLLLAVLMIDYYSVLYADNIMINDFMSLSEKNYAYSDVSSIEHSTWVDDDNNTKHGYKVFFNDGYDWNFSGGFYELNDEKLNSVLGILTEKTGLTISEKEK